MPIAAPQLSEEAKQARGLVVPGARPQVDPVWLAVAAGDIHGEGRLFMPQPTDAPQQVADKKGGTYIGDLPDTARDDDLAYDRSEPIGRREGPEGKVKRNKTPTEMLMLMNPDEEGFTLPDNPHMFIRKKRPNAPEVPTS